MNPFRSIWLIIIIFICSCSYQRTYSPSDLVGTWKFTNQLGDSSSTVLINAMVSYEESGKCLVEGEYAFKVGDKKATWHYRDISTWRIDGLYIIENTIDYKFYNYNGDKELIDFVKNVDHTDNGEDRAKILELSKTKMVVLMNLDENPLKVVFHRIQ